MYTDSSSPVGRAVVLGMINDFADCVSLNAFNI